MVIVKEDYLLVERTCVGEDGIFESMDKKSAKWDEKV